MTITIIPAAAGYYALWRADNDRGYGRAPVAAWRVDTNEDDDVAFTAPVIDGEPGPKVEAILCPDRTVNEVDGGDWWETITDWVGVRS